MSRSVKIIAPTATISTIIVAVCLVVIVIFSMGAGESLFDGVLTQFDYQKPYQGSFNNWKHSAADFEAEYNIARGGKEEGNAAILRMLDMADDNYYQVSSGAQTLTSTDITLRNNSKFKGEGKIVQRSTYAIIQKDGHKYVQTVSGMTQLSLGSADISGIAQNFGYLEREYSDGVMEYRQGGKNPIFNKPKTALGGVTATWNGKVRSWENEPSTEPSKTELERFEEQRALAAADPQLEERPYVNYFTGDPEVMVVGGKEFTTGYYLKDEESYYYMRSDQLTYYVYNEETKEVERDWVWDEFAQKYNDYTRDGNGSTIDKSKNLGKMLVRGSYLHTGHIITMETIDADATKISVEKDRESGKEYYAISLRIKEEWVDFACRYPKASMTGDIRDFTAAYNLTYTGLEMEIHIWKDTGLFKIWSRKEDFKAYAHQIIAGIGYADGEATNNIDEIFSYSEKDTDYTPYIGWAK